MAALSNLKTVAGQGLAVFKEWPNKYQLAFLMMLAIIVFYLCYGVALLFKADWQGLTMIGAVCVLPTFATNPECLFLPLQ